VGCDEGGDRLVDDPGVLVPSLSDEEVFSTEEDAIPIPKPRVRVDDAPKPTDPRERDDERRVDRSTLPPPRLLPC
jgi:hypothetical protein